MDILCWLSVCGRCLLCVCCVVCCLLLDGCCKVFMVSWHVIGSWLLLVVRCSCCVGCCVVCCVL